MSLNKLKTPRIVIQSGVEDVEHIWIVNKSYILQEFEPSEKFTNILICLLAYYTVLDIQYHISHEILFGFFHEVIEIEQPVFFENKKGIAYSKFLDCVISSISK